MNTKLILSLTAATCAVVGADAATKSVDNRPNVLLLLADDMGYSELGCYGQELIETPNLDRLAREGVQLTDFHAGNAVSSPSRAVLMTGIPSGFNIIRGNIGQNLENGGTRVPLRKSDVTMAEMLKGNGYQTAFIGKWHLGDPNDLSTWAFARGFDFASQEQWSDKNSTREFTEGMEYINGLQDSIWYDNRKWNCKDEFRTNIAFDYLDKQLDKDKPFFLFMSYRAPHAHEWYLNNKELYADRGWPENERMHAAKITLLDMQIGRLLDKLEEMGELDNTIIIFTSDNGPQNEGHDYDFFKSNGDLKGYKRDAFEGGHRVPCIINWKGKINSGLVSDYICGGQDIMPTVAEAVGVQAPPEVQGLSLLPALKGDSEPNREALYWEFMDSGFSRQAVRMGKWKADRYGVKSPIRLYDLSIDIGETNDVSAQHPDVMAKITPLFESMREENKYYPRFQENILNRFLMARSPRANIIADNPKILIEEISVKVKLKITQSNAPQSDSYIIRSMLFEERGLEIIRQSNAVVLSNNKGSFTYTQVVDVDNLKPNIEYFIRCEVVKSVDIDDITRGEIIDAIVLPFKI
ncbi:MAG: sulfatase-like hydrolase/transferase [Rikenellaceae bacterium]